MFCLEGFALCLLDYIEPMLRFVYVKGTVREIAVFES